MAVNFTVKFKYQDGELLEFTVPWAIYDEDPTAPVERVLANWRQNYNMAQFVTDTGVIVNLNLDGIRSMTAKRIDP